MSMVEREQDHRQHQDKAVLDATIKDTRRGHWMGWTISMAALAGAGITAHLGAHPAVSIALVSLPIVAIVQAFLRTKSSAK